MRQKQTRNAIQNRRTGRNACFKDSGNEEISGASSAAHHQHSQEQG